MLRISNLEEKDIIENEIEKALEKRGLVKHLKNNGYEHDKWEDDKVKAMEVIQIASDFRVLKYLSFDLRKDKEVITLALKINPKNKMYVIDTNRIFY